MSIVITVINAVFQIYSILILIRVILTWVNTDPYRPRFSHPIVHLLNKITDPVLVPLGRIIPPIGGTLDITPIVALLLLQLARRILVGFLAGL
jgi:YggT family protein